MLWEESTVSRTEGEDTCSRRPRHPAHLCSWSRPTCLSTNPLASQLIWDLTPVARPSLSACLTPGRSCPEIQWLRVPRHTRLWRTARQGKV